MVRRRAGCVFFVAGGYRAMLIAIEEAVKVSYSIGVVQCRYIKGERVLVAEVNVYTGFSSDWEVIKLYV